MEDVGCVELTGETLDEFFGHSALLEHTSVFFHLKKSDTFQLSVNFFSFDLGVKQGFSGIRSN